MGQAQINVRTRACSRTSIARTKQAALTHNVRGKELKLGFLTNNEILHTLTHIKIRHIFNIGYHLYIPRMKGNTDKINKTLEFNIIIIKFSKRVNRSEGFSGKLWWALINKSFKYQ